MNAIVPKERKSLLTTMAHGYGMEANTFAATVRKTCMPASASDEDFAAFLLVANEHGLNPITREIYAFPKKGGGVQPIVGIDGWMTLINKHPQSDGIEFEDHINEKDELTAITCRIYRKDRSRPTEVTEYMNECLRPTEPWQKWPARMLRHKAAIQCARYAFGFAGIIDPEEAERSPEVETGNVVAPPPEQIAQAEPETAAEVSEEAEAVTFEFDPTAFLDELEIAISGAHDAEGLEDVWTEFDVGPTLEDHPGHLETAEQMKATALKAFETVRVAGTL